MTLAEKVKTEVPRALEDLAALVAVPSVSSMPEHAADVLRSAELVRDLYAAEGVEARVVTTGGAQPAVIGRKAGPPGAPTVLLYGHHDVQPTGDLSRWTTDPFTQVRRDDRLFGRGTSDDKGAVALHLALLRAFGPDLPVNLVFLVEGEEEIGSPGFGRLLEGHVDELRADVVVVPDAVNPTPDTPSLTVALRGIHHLFVELCTLSRPVHSGLYGGVLPCALTSLIQLLATLHDEDGQLAVPGLERQPGPAPQVVLELDGVSLEGVEQLGSGSLGERLVSSHSVTVLALDAVPVAEASNVLHARARAKLGIRIPPGDDPHEALGHVQAHLQRNVRHGMHLMLEPGHSGVGFRADVHSPVWAEAARAAYGTDSVDVGAGGSIPFVAALAEAFPKAQILITAVQDSGSNAHSYDESLHVAGFEKACVAHALLLAGLGS
jgi:acetylornithine deacetylase/succinyl-diaminopimelate desuccinylase-like protein